MKRLLIGIAATALLVCQATRADATVYNLVLNGKLADATTGSFAIGSDQYRIGGIVLTGLTPFNLEAGDVVHATVTLDGLFTVPGSGEQLFGFNLLQFLSGGGGATADPAQPTDNGGAITFFNSLGPTGRNNDFAPGACSNCLTIITDNGGLTTPFSFDSFTADTMIGNLGTSPFEINGATFSYQLRDAIGAVPELETWAMMLLGFGAIGGTLRQRRRALPALA
ncbi:MAG: hypothetical protein JWR80_3182 [Bradyrhizobium sp.]|nr:hypothetical protein [Bradyrhizobium sp.]